MKEGDPAEALIAICRRFAAFEKDQVCCGTVTVAQCVVLQALLSGPSEAAVLAETHGVTRSAMTRLLDGLEKKDWIRREHSAEDRRRIGISLTRAGKKEAVRLYDITKRSIATLLQEIPQEKRAQVSESIVLIRDALERSRDQIACC